MKDGSVLPIFFSDRGGAQPDTCVVELGHAKKI
jgi:hypothetical protein